MQLILTKNKLFSGILFFGLITIFLVLFDVQYLYLRAFFSFVFLTTIPGLLIMLMLKIKKIGFWEYLVYIVGLSIAFLMFGGLAVNWTLPWLNITNKPLSLTPLLISINTILLIFGLIAYVRNKDISFEIKPAKLDWSNKIFFITPVIFLILSILGTITLNNGGSNYLIMLTIGGITIYVFLISIFHTKINENILLCSLFFICLSALLMMSLRSLHISGWDINQEYLVFQLTKLNSHWVINNFRDPYNACLSITILPTILSRFINIPDEYIYKLVFQIMFAIIVLNIYQIFKRYTGKIICYLSCFFFISQPRFLGELIALNRQEIGLLYFSLVILVLFTNEISIKVRNILFIIFTFSLAVSHYSTAFITIFILLAVYLSFKILKLLLLNTKIIESLRNIYFFKLQNIVNAVKFIPLLTFIAFTFIWYSQLTDNVLSPSKFIFNTANKIGDIFNNDLKSESAKLLFNNSSLDDNKLLVDYYQKYTGGNIQEISQKYDYVPSVVYEDIPATHSNLLSIFSIAKQFVKYFSLVSMVVGVIYYLIIKNKSIDIEYILFSVFSALAVLSVFLIPTEYSFERMYQQMLIILAFPIIAGSFLIINIFSKQKILTLILISIIYITNFLIYYGFITQFTGGRLGAEQTRHLENKGKDYDLYHIHSEEVISAQWLSKYMKGQTINADGIATLRLISFARLTDMKQIQPIIFPNNIKNNTYVYLSYTNTVKNIAFALTGVKVVEYIYPRSYLEYNKNTIYNNGGSIIFR